MTAKKTLFRMPIGQHHMLCRVVSHTDSSPKANRRISQMLMGVREKEAA